MAGKPMSPAEAEALAAVAPPFKDLESGARKGDVVEAKEEKKGKDPKEKEQQEQQAKEQTVELPADIQSQFPDSDLSKVVVILNSGEATKRRLKGFAENGTIHIAEGADQKPVMRHEASHIAQQLKGEKGEAPAGGGAGERVLAVVIRGEEGGLALLDRGSRHGGHHASVGELSDGGVYEWSLARGPQHGPGVQLGIPRLSRFL